MLTFVERIILFDMFNEWANRNKVKDCGQNLIAYLCITKVIDEDKAKELMLKGNENIENITHIDNTKTIKLIDKENCNDDLISRNYLIGILEHNIEIQKDDSSSIVAFDSAKLIEYIKNMPSAREVIKE